MMHFTRAACTALVITVLFKPKIAQRGTMDVSQTVPAASICPRAPSVRALWTGILWPHGAL